MRAHSTTIDRSPAIPEVSRQVSRLVDGDLNGLNDYRLVLAEILVKRCGAGSVSQIFPGISQDRLGVVRPR